MDCVGETWEGKGKKLHIECPLCIRRLTGITRRVLVIVPYMILVTVLCGNYYSSVSHKKTSSARLNVLPKLTQQQ